jgi:hypothetical protein
VYRKSGFKRFLLILIGFSPVLTQADNYELTAKLRSGYCSEHAGLILVEIKNNTNSWLEIEQVNIGFGDSEIDKKVKILNGDYLAAWYEGIVHKISWTKQVAGSSAAVEMDRDPDSDGGIAGIPGLTVAEAAGSAEQSEYFPRTHLLSLPILIPPKLLTVKWIVVDSQNDPTIPLLISLEMELKTNSGESVRLKDQFRNQVIDKDMNCIWQKPLQKCDPSDFNCY